MDNWKNISSSKTDWTNESVNNSLPFTTSFGLFNETHLLHDMLRLDIYVQQCYMKQNVAIGQYVLEIQSCLN